MIVSGRILFTKEGAFRTRTLYDLPENLGRRRELLSLSIRRGFEPQALEMKLSRLNDSDATSSNRFRRRVQVWESRPNGTPTGGSPETLHIPRRPVIGVNRPELHFARPSLKVHIPPPPKRVD